MARKSAGVPQPVEEEVAPTSAPLPPAGGDLTVLDEATEQGKGGYMGGQGGVATGGSTASPGTGGST